MPICLSLVYGGDKVSTHTCDLSMNARKTLLRAATLLLLLACLLWAATGAWQRWGMSAKEHIAQIVGQEVPQAKVVNTIADDGFRAIFFELPREEAAALWQRVEASSKNRAYPLDPQFTFGIGEEELHGLTGSFVLLPFRGDGACRYLVRLADGTTFVAIKACYGI